ncbi:5-oxoprolinase subunit PxpB [Aquibacillus halophilus]|uniref:5-oxoprolinase subunit PxpB n=1 Tax=Aquibacillus halophilus TaxID=930132 RepID=A0A6A8DL22_9BACI|nr:5-oxoprolinase subunit PxpB [Aquibacillus halophilus]MRH41942.1 5-oxoprolinase subunit PxpB [Aquibacillus halophilus]
MDDFQYAALSETAIIIDFGKKITIEKNTRILQLAERLANNPFLGFIESVPSYTTLTIYYNPLAFSENPYKQVCLLIDDYLSITEQFPLDTKTVSIPVCYDLLFGFDLQEVASTNKLTTDQVINYHKNKIYHVFFLGFTPGFPFLGGVDSKIATPRKETPRMNIPAGSVGIAGNQTGIYPIDSPGGWQIIGRTPVSLLQIDQESPTLIQPGDKIKFYSITKEEFSSYY